MNWGKAIALSLIGFAAMLATLFVIGSRHMESLVTEEYYAEELRYQERIDAQARAHALSTPVRFDAADDRIVLNFPAELAGKTITGTLTLLRPNDANGDRTIAIGPLTDAAFASGPLGLSMGRYDASLDWQVDGVSYHSADKLVVQ